MAWSGLFCYLERMGRLHSRSCLTSLGFGLYFASRRPSDLLGFLLGLIPWGSFFTPGVLLFISSSCSLILWGKGLGFRFHTVR